VHKDLLIKEYANFFKGQPYALAAYGASHLLHMNRWHIFEYLDYISSDACSHESLLRFSSGLLDRVHMMALCHGNLSKADALKLVNDAAATLNKDPLQPSQRPALRLLQLPADVEVVCRLHASLCTPSQKAYLSADDPNSAVDLILQAGVEQGPDTAICELLGQALSQPAYTQLRTQEQLGYIVSMSTKCELGVLGLRVIVQSSTKDAAAIDDRIEAFLATVPDVLAQMTDEEFNNHREALITAKVEPPKVLQHETGIYWHAIASGTCDFKKELRHAAELKTLTREQVVDYWNRTFDAKAPGRRKLSSQIFARQHKPPPRRPLGVNGRKVHYVDSLSDVIKYKRTLAAYPAPSSIHKDSSWC